MRAALLLALSGGAAGVRVLGAVAALSADDEIFNLISPEETSTGEIALMMRETFGFEVTFLRDKPEGKSMPYMSPRKAIRHIGWKPTPLVEQFHSYVQDPEGAIGNLGVDLLLQPFLQQILLLEVLGEARERGCDRAPGIRVRQRRWIREQREGAREEQVAGLRRGLAARRRVRHVLGGAELLVEALCGRERLRVAIDERVCARVGAQGERTRGGDHAQEDRAGHDLTRALDRPPRQPSENAAQLISPSPAGRASRR